MSTSEKIRLSSWTYLHDKYVESTEERQQRVEAAVSHDR